MSCIFIKFKFKKCRTDHFHASEHQRWLLSDPLVRIGSSDKHESMSREVPRVIQTSWRSRSTVTLQCRSSWLPRQDSPALALSSMRLAGWTGQAMSQALHNTVSIHHPCGLEQPGYSKSTPLKASDLSISRLTSWDRLKTKPKSQEECCRQFKSSKISTPTTSLATARTR